VPKNAAAKRVLIVDDDDAVRTLMFETAVDMEVEVDDASNGARALVEIGRHRYDAIVLDLMMPVVNGMKVLLTLREAGIDTPVIITTGVDQPSILGQVERLGVATVLVKPFTPLDLQQALFAALEPAGRTAPAPRSAKHKVVGKRHLPWILGGLAGAALAAATLFVLTDATSSVGTGEVVLDERRTLPPENSVSFTLPAGRYSVHVKSHLRSVTTNLTGGDCTPCEGRNCTITCQLAERGEITVRNPYSILGRKIEIHVVATAFVR
jgi:CheY-like chemotaxis protein